MPTRIRWRNLVPGLAALAAVVVLALGVLMFAGVGQIRGEKVHLYVRTSQSRGVLRGSDVWLAGQRVGTVDGVSFASPSPDSEGRVVIAFSVKASEADKIRRDSRAQVRAGTNIIGPIVVYLSPGTPNSPAVTGGDTLHARAEAALDGPGAKLSAAADELGPLLADGRQVMSRMRDSTGTIGAALQSRGGPEIGRLRVQVARLREQMFGAPARPHIAVVLQRTHTVLARTDSIRALVNSPNSSLGRFRRDSTLGSTVRGLRDELAALRARLDAGEGTLGRYQSDSAFMRSVVDAQREMTLLFADIQRRPLRYVVF